MCDMPSYRKMTCDSTMGKCYMGQFMQHVKIIKFGSYMVHMIFVQATLNTPNYVQHFPNYIQRAAPILQWIQNHIKSSTK